MRTVLAKLAQNSQMTTQIIIHSQNFELLDNGVSVTGQPDFSEWAAFFTKLISAGESIALAIGDMLNYGFDHYPDEVAQLFDPNNEHPVYALGTLQNLKYITDKWPHSRRREFPKNVPITYFQETSSLPEGTREAVLKEALDNGHKREWIRKKKKEFANEQPDYSPLISKIILLIQKLEAVYPAGVYEIQMYLENSL